MCETTDVVMKNKVNMENTVSSSTKAVRKKPFTPLCNCETLRLTSSPTSLLPLVIVNMLFLVGTAGYIKVQKENTSLITSASTLLVAYKRPAIAGKWLQSSLILHFIYKDFTVVYVQVHGEHKLNFSWEI